MSDVRNLIINYTPNGINFEKKLFIVVSFVAVNKYIFVTLCWL